MARCSRIKPLCALFIGGVFSFTLSLWTCQLIKVFPFGCPTRGTLINTRVKTFNEELRTKGFIFIAVMTSENYMTTRARGVWETWGREVSGRLIFFTGQTNQTNWKGLPVVQLDVEDNAYPPQRKALTMLKYVYEHFVDDYEWFIRADDDVYMRADRLASYLWRLNSSDDLVVGQPGTGKKEEIGLLGLGENDNFCIGGPGIIMTSSVLRRMGPHLTHCINATASYHEDAEVGRCIRRFGGVMCPWAYEMKEFFRQVYVKPLEAYHETLDTVEMEKAINLHPVKDPAYMRRMHIRFMKSKMESLNERELILRRTLVKTKMLLRKRIYWMHIQKELLDPRDRARRSTRNSTQPWELFDFSKVWALKDKPPLRYIHDGTEAGTTKIVNYTKEVLIREGEASALHTINFEKWHSGYMRIHPTEAAEYIVDMPTKYQLRLDRKVQITRTRRMVHLRQKFGRFIYLPKTVDVDAKITLHFIVPLVDRLENFKRFLRSFEEEFLANRDPVKLLVVYFPDASSPVEQKEAFERYTKKYPSVGMKWLDVKGPFKRAVALQTGTDYFGDKSLLYFCDVDLVFRREFADRCRANAMIGKRAYFPVMFSQFNPNITYANKQPPKTHYYYAKEAGFWRWYSFGPVCVYGKDIKDSGGLNTSLLGWGLEDVDLYEKFVKRNDIEIFRAPDPGLVHVYHPHASCDPDSNEEQKAMCRAAQADLFSSAPSAVDFFGVRGYLDFLNS